MAVYYGTIVVGQITLGNVSGLLSVKVGEQVVFSSPGPLKATNFKASFFRNNTSILRNGDKRASIKHLLTVSVSTSEVSAS